MIAGLGNPGPRYADTRHNFGFMAVDALLRHCREHAAQTVTETPLRKAKGELHRLELPGIEGQWLALKPQTYMNESGLSVGHVCGFYKLPPAQLIVLHDELDLPLGRMKLKQGGGNAGHNGLKSIAAHLGSNDFLRLRLGIGKPEHPDTRGYVLQPFAAQELPLVAEVLSGCVAGIVQLVKEGFVPAQQTINGFVVADQEQSASGS